MLDLFNRIYLYFSSLKLNRLNLKMTQEDKNLYIKTISFFINVLARESSKNKKKSIKKFMITIKIKTTLKI